MKYVSPYEITNDMLVLVSSIMKKIGKLDNYKDLDKMPVLRKNNRIKSIYSSLAIEANSLSFNEVKDVIEGKTVIGPEKEIQEVKNILGNLNENVEQIYEYKNCFFWSYELKNYRKSNWWVKTSSTYIKDSITIRTANTVKKLLEICKK